jgi:hypothetical protein
MFTAAVAIPIALLIMLAHSCSMLASTPAPQPDPALQKLDQMRERDAIAQAFAETKVRAILKDPDSATFQDELVMNNGLPIVCGRVNARNSFSGLTGFTPFIVIGDAAQTYEGAGAASFRRAWNRLCMDGAATGQATKNRHHH